MCVFLASQILLINKLFYYYISIPTSQTRVLISLTIYNFGNQIDKDRIKIVWNPFSTTKPLNAYYL